LKLHEPVLTIISSSLSGGLGEVKADDTAVVWMRSLPYSVAVRCHDFGLGKATLQTAAVRAALKEAVRTGYDQQNAGCFAASPQRSSQI